MAWADIDITELYLRNAGFDDSDHFDYRIGDNGNVAQEILPVHGWQKDITVDYTVSGVYQFGTSKTFNTYGRVPQSGYSGKNGGCLALSTGWDQEMKYFQTVTLPHGSYRIQSAFYNGSNTTDGRSLLAWVPEQGSESVSALSGFPLNSWKEDNVSFTLANETTGKIQTGLGAVSGGSANTAKVVCDYVRLMLVGNDASLISDIRSELSSSIKSAESMVGKGTPASDKALSSEISRAKAVEGSQTASYSDIFKAKASLGEATYSHRLANSTLANPIDFTAMIENPSFEKGFTGWAQSGMQTQSNTSFTLKSGNTYVEKWVQSGNALGNVKVEQSLELPVGIYVLKVSAQNLKNDAGGQKGAYIYAGQVSKEVSNRETYSLQFTNIDAEVTFGFRTENPSGNWVAVDNFSLYYAAATVEDCSNELSRRLSSAKKLADGRMNASHRSALVKAMSDAEKWIASPDAKTLQDVSSSLMKAWNSASASALAYEMLGEQISEASKYEAQASGSADFMNILSAARKVYDDETQTIADVSQKTDELRNATLIYLTSIATGPVPEVKTDMRHARGATMAFGRASFSGKGIVEKGFCWSTHNNPTIADHRTTKSYSNNGDIYVIDGLLPATFYYIRPYALTDQNAVGYGRSIKICTLPMGTVTWSYNNGGSADENARINSAVADACDNWNNIANIHGLHLTVSYGASTPTADCSYGGWMRVGPNASYQRTGTIQHEMAHAIGVGTIDRWYNSDVYRQNVSSGFWLGERTDQVLAFLENNDEAHLKGDKTHFWPYGINGANEDNGSRMLYLANALIVQSLGEDNLPPVKGAFASPAYTFIQEDNEYYYILSADNVSSGKYSLLRSSGSGVSVESGDWSGVLRDNSYAWQVRFNPATQLYEFRNVMADRSMTANGGRVDMKGGDSYGIQMLGSRSNVSTDDFNLKSYWLTFADGTDTPSALSKSFSQVSATRFDHTNSATSQRWVILSRQEVKALAGDWSQLESLQADSPIAVYSREGGVVVESFDKGGFVFVADMGGKVIRQFYMQAGMKLDVSLQKGVYAVNGRKVIVK